MKPLEILLLETRNGFFKARVKWMEGGKECRGYTRNYTHMSDTLLQAHSGWLHAALYTCKSGASGRFCGKGAPS